MRKSDREREAREKREKMAGALPPAAEMGKSAAAKKEPTAKKRVLLSGAKRENVRGDEMVSAVQARPLHPRAGEQWKEQIFGQMPSVVTWLLPPRQVVSLYLLKLILHVLCSCSCFMMVFAFC